MTKRKTITLEEKHIHVTESPLSDINEGDILLKDPNIILFKKKVNIKRELVIRKSCDVITTAGAYVSDTLSSPPVFRFYTQQYQVQESNDPDLGKTVYLYKPFNYQEFDKKVRKDLCAKLEEAGLVECEVHIISHKW